ncbi:MAG: efflux RND transporter permease subunit [Anaerolineae bacterium]|nr:efflux RND transporter permease subunit [Anaerolineae bacterium]
MSPDVMIYLMANYPTFSFQLAPDVWAELPDETVEAMLAYLASQVAASNDAKSALEQLVEQEVLPQIEAVDLVANVVIAGGQALPGETSSAFATIETDEEAQSLLFQLSPDVWEVVAARIDGISELNQDAVETLSNIEVRVPEITPVLPESWQFDHFHNASDLEEMASLTRPIVVVFNDFVTTGTIKGALGQTDDLTPDVIEQMLAIDPTLAQYFEAEHLVAMSQDVFDSLPEDLNLDGFTRDDLAAAALARSLTGSSVTPDPVDLPAPWMISPPQIITFSLADLPLATFSVFSTAAPDETVDSSDENTTSETSNVADESASDIVETPEVVDYPEGPELPRLYALLGEQFGVELDTADDLLEIRLSPEIAQVLGGDDIVFIANLLPQAAQLAEQFLGTGDEGTDAPESPFGDIAAFDPASFARFMPALAQCNIDVSGLIGGGGEDGFDIAPITNGLINCLDSEVIAYLLENDPSIAIRLSPAVLDLMSADALAVDGISPLLSNVWSALSDRPEFQTMALRSADDVLALGDGSAAQVLDTINREVPSRFEGYEVRLFDSLSPTILAYFAANEDDFYANLDSDVLLKLAPTTLAAIPDDVLETLPEDVREQALAIVSGEQASAIQALADLYTSEEIPERPDAPILNDEWDEIAQFMSVQLNNAYDMFRFPEAMGTPSEFINGLFDSPGGTNFAPDLLGYMPLDAFNYIADEDPNFVNELEPRALILLSEEIYQQLPQAIRDKAESGEVFIPTTQVTRSNGAPSLLITIFKEADANTVTVFHDVDDVIRAISDANPNIDVEVAFEQSSFIEESISSVFQSGMLGAVFAVVNILIFLSGDMWGRQGRSITGMAVIVISVLFLVMLYFLNGSSTERIFSEDLILVTVLGIFGLIAGFGILVWPGRLPFPSWRPTLVIAVSIPLSILSALALMHWLPPAMNAVLGQYSDNGFVAFILKLAPESLTLNIMTLSGLTVAVGRLVDDSIVVLENIFRELQSGKDKREAVLYATRDVSVAIFSATSIAVIVFLPLGLTGGLISEFFLPFGLAVTYTLLSSFLTAITVVPVLAYMFISSEHVPSDEETWMQRIYVPVLEWVIGTVGRRVIVLLFAIALFFASIWLLGQRPAAFLPQFGEAQLVISVSMPQGTSLIETNDRVLEVESAIREVIPAEDLNTIRTIVGGGGLDFEALLGGGGVSENQADVTVTINSSERLDEYTNTMREEANVIFGEENVTVGAVSFGDGGFGGFELVLSGADQDVLEDLNDDIIAALENFPELSNVSSNLADDDETGPATLIRVNGTSALTFVGELQTDDTINFLNQAIETVRSQVDLPEGVVIGQGFDSELQTEGFQSTLIAIPIAGIFVVIILILVFRSPIYWLVVMLSVLVAPIGAAIALTITDRVFGISSIIGLLMLLGLVVTNAIVLIDRVGSNRTERGMNLHDAVVEAGSRRIRPILMTALTTIIGLIPLSLGLAEGAIIAAELGTVVIGGVISSTLLTLIVVPAAYYLATPIHSLLTRPFGGGRSNETQSSPEKEK